MANNKINWAKTPQAVESNNPDTSFLHNIAAVRGVVRTVEHSDHYVNALYLKMVDKYLNECTLFIDSIEAIDALIKALDDEKTRIRMDSIQLGAFGYESESVDK